MSQQLNLFAIQRTTQQMADEGMKQAVDHADAVDENWSGRAYELFVRYARTRRLFMTEDARVWAHEQGLAHPPDKRAWGAVTNRAVRAGIICRDHYEKTKIPPAHATPRPVWRWNAA